MKVVHVLADGTKVEKIDGHVVNSKEFYRVIKKIISKSGGFAK